MLFRSLIALLNRRDPNHQRCLTATKSLPVEPLLTTWCCLTETMYFLGKIGGYPAQRPLWNFIFSDQVKLYDFTFDDSERMDMFMRKYHDVPMDLADASLVVAAEQNGIRQILTLDSDFFVYRLSDGSAFQCYP